MIDVVTEQVSEADDPKTMVSLRLPMSWLFEMDRIIRAEGGDRSKLLRELLTTPRHIVGE